MEMLPSYDKFGMVQGRSLHDLNFPPWRIGFFEENIWFCKILRRDELCIFTESCIDLSNKYVHIWK